MDDVKAKKSAEGGAIYNNTDGTIELNSNFVNNYATSTTTSNAGAIYNSGTVNITGDFLENYADGQNASGGAIYNAFGGNLDVKSTLTNNFATASDSAKGGALYNLGNAKISGDILNNYVSGINSAYGGAIYNINTGLSDMNTTTDKIANIRVALSGRNTETGEVLTAYIASKAALFIE